jgi:hypothetical protein
MTVGSRSARRPPILLVDGPGSGTLRGPDVGIRERGELAMTCGHCGAIAQRGRFCTGCGMRMPLPLQPMGPVRRIARRPESEPAPAAG